MSDKDINFDKVRELDTKYKKRTPEWSGQVVLDIGLNISKSKWVIKKMNKLRVWPKGFYNMIKKIRCVMKSFVRFSLFENFLTVCVLINTVVMAMDSYDIDPQTEKDLEDMKRNIAKHESKLRNLQKNASNHREKWAKKKETLQE